MIGGLVKSIMVGGSWPYMDAAAAKCKTNTTVKAAAKEAVKTATKPKILVYDIETSLMLMSGFRLGKQVIRPNQLLNGYFSRVHIICITYQWVGSKSVEILTWGDSVEDEARMIEDFDALVKKADIVIGKNSDRFDNKHINTHRFWNNLPADNVNWTESTDDLEKQMRKHFNLASYSLDYMSSQLGLGGKDKMEYSDWEHIQAYRLLQLVAHGSKKTSRELVGDKTAELFGTSLFNLSVETIIRRGQTALKKMYKYGKKDTRDTTSILQRMLKYIKPKFNHSVFAGKLACKLCGHIGVSPNGSFISGQTKYKKFKCQSCKGYAGSVPHKAYKKALENGTLQDLVIKNK